MTPSAPGRPGRRFWCAVAYLIGFWALFALLAYLLLFVVPPVHAQGAVSIDLEQAAQEHDETVVAEAPKSDDGGLLGRIADGMAEGIQRAWNHWLETSGITALIDGFLTSMGQMAQSYLEGTAKIGPGDCDVMNELDAGCVLDNPTVVTMMQRSAQVFNALIGAGTIYLGFYLLIAFGGSPLKELAPALPRLFIALWAVNNAADLLRVVFQGAGELGRFLAGNTQPLGEAIQGNLTPQTAGGTLTILAVVMTLLIIQRIMMHGLLIALAVTACLAFATAVIPPWSKWFWRWFGLLVGLVLAASLQTILMNAGTAMMVHAMSGLDGPGKSVTGGLFALGTLGTAISAPAIVGAGGGIGGTTLGLLRRVGRLGRGRGRSRGGGGGSGNGEREVIEAQETEASWEVRSGGGQDTAPRATVEAAPPAHQEPVVLYRSIAPQASARQEALPPPSEYVEFTKKEDDDK